MHKSAIAIAAAAFAVAVSMPVGSADDSPPPYTLDDVVTVVQCYKTCALAYDQRAHDVKADLAGSGRDKALRCRSTRNALVAIRACESSCNEVWTTLHKPPTKLRVPLRTMLDADETAFDESDCHKGTRAHGRTDGIGIAD